MTDFTSYKNFKEHLRQEMRDGSRMLEETTQYAEKCETTENKLLVFANEWIQESAYQAYIAFQMLKMLRGLEDGEGDEALAMCEISRLAHIASYASMQAKQVIAIGNSVPKNRIWTDISIGANSTIQCIMRNQHNEASDET